MHDGEDCYDQLQVLKRLALRLLPEQLLVLIFSGALFLHAFLDEEAEGDADIKTEESCLEIKEVNEMFRSLI